MQKQIVALGLKISMEIVGIFGIFDQGGNTYKREQYSYNIQCM